MNKLEKISYSKLSTYEQCPRKFLHKYEEKKYSNTTSLALEIGTITHYGKELVANAIIAGEKPDYPAIKDIVMQGYINEKPDGTFETIPGATDLKEKYLYEWHEVCEKSGMDYNQKLAIYMDNLNNLEVESSLWRPIATEYHFDTPYTHEGEDLFRLHGFIDRVDQNQQGDLRVADYKSSKKLFDDKDIKTPMQMFFYTLALEKEMGKTPVEHLYDFMFLDQFQLACSKGYYKRGHAKLLKLWQALQESRATGIYKPKPTPLCHWCEYSKTNPNATEDYKHECPYHSLWTPQNKTYEKNMEFDEHGKSAPASENSTSKEFWF